MCKDVMCEIETARNNNCIIENYLKMLNQIDPARL